MKLYNFHPALVGDTVLTIEELASARLSEGHPFVGQLPSGKLLTGETPSSLRAQGVVWMASSISPQDLRIARGAVKRLGFNLSPENVYRMAASFATGCTVMLYGARVEDPVSYMNDNLVRRV